MDKTKVLIEIHIRSLFLMSYYIWIMEGKKQINYQLNK